MTKKISKIKVYVAGSKAQEIYGTWIKGYKLVSAMAEADLIVFVGGADIGPGMYGQKRIDGCFIDEDNDARDAMVFSIARTLDVPMVGICRGSQFLCVKAGGTLIQDCDNHGIYGTHTIVNNEGDEFEITSTHHQMANLSNLDKDKYKLIAKAVPKRSTYYKDDTGYVKMDVEPEIVYYKEINALGIQGHPEYMDPSMPVVSYLNILVQKLLKGQL